MDGWNKNHQRLRPFLPRLGTSTALVYAVAHVHNSELITMVIMPRCVIEDNFRHKKEWYYYMACTCKLANQKTRGTRLKGGLSQCSRSGDGFAPLLCLGHSDGRCSFTY